MRIASKENAEKLLARWEKLPTAANTVESLSKYPSWREELLDALLKRMIHQAISKWGPLSRSGNGGYADRKGVTRVILPTFKAWSMVLEDFPEAK